MPGSAPLAPVVSPSALRALLFGEALVDIFPDRRVVAGAPLHVAGHLAASGWHAALITRVGADEAGAAIRSRLAALGVDQQFVESDGELPTGTVTVVPDPAGGHAFRIHAPAAWDAVEGPRQFPPHDVMYYGSLAARAPASRAAWRRCLTTSNAEWRVFDVNLRPPFVDADVLAAGAARATLLKVTAEEFETVASLLGRQATAPAFFDAFPALQFVAVTRGASGASLVARGGDSWSEPAPQTRVVDTVGAGDAFTASLLAALVDGSGGRAALTMAVAAATRSLSHRGGLPA